jgi:DNA-binding NtrC family response regulator
VVDDEPSLTRVAAKFLKRLGYRATEAHSAAEALEVCHRPGEEIELVITDLTMPNLNGIGLANALYPASPQLPVILATGFDGTRTAERDRPPNICSLMQKPYTAEILAKTINSVLTGKGGSAKYSAATSTEPVTVKTDVPTPDTERSGLIPGMRDLTKLALIGAAKGRPPESGFNPELFSVKSG